MRTVIVIGGGLAGLAAAVELAGAGFRVTVLEKAPRLGGRAHSFEDRALGHACDNGQHLFIAGYRNARAFLAKIGAAGDLVIQPALAVRFVAPGGRSFDFRATRRLPAPFHLLPAFLRHPLLSARDRAAAARAAAAILSLDEARLAAAEPLRFDEWLRAHGQPRALVDAFWEVITLATINAPSSVVSAYPILKVLRLGFLGSADAGRLAWAAVPLGDLFGERAAAFIRARGGDVRLRARVRGIARDGAGGRVVGVDLDGGGAAAERLAADVYVSAIPFGALRALAPDLVPGALRPAPIVDVHLRVDREVLDAPFAALLGARAAQWVWNRGRMLRPGCGCAGMLSVTISGAEEALELPPAEIERRVIEDLRAFLPPMREAALLGVRTIKEPHATLRLAPGVERLRPPARTALANLFLAGDWTDTGLPSTIEGAVISGFRAAEAATGRRIVLPLEALQDLPSRALRFLNVAR